MTSATNDGERADDLSLADYRDPVRSRADLTRMGAAAWDLALEWLYGTAFQRPVLADSYAESRLRFFGPTGTPRQTPGDPAPWEGVFREFSERVLPGTFSGYHTRCFSYFTPPPLPMSIIGETLAQWIDQGVDIWHGSPSATLVEEEVIAWLRALVGYPDESFGVLTSGGGMANIMAVAMMRDVHLTRVLHLPEPPRAEQLRDVRVYASEQSHFSIARAIDLMGFPSDTLRLIPCDGAFRMSVPDLDRSIQADRHDGLLPFALVGVAGSTNTGSVDPVPQLAALAEREGMWLHVDAAYGAAALLSDRDAGRVRGLDLADSITIDPHKWFFQAYDIGGLLVRRRGDLISTFHRAPEYLRSLEDEPLNWYQYSIEGTRRFRALKLWMSWKHLGTRGLGRLVERTNDLALYLHERCKEDPWFEPALEHPELSVVCFRLMPPRRADMTPAELDVHQDAVQGALEASGDGWVSTTKLGGHTYLRAGVMNYMSTSSDVDQLMSMLRDCSRSIVDG